MLKDELRQFCGSGLFYKYRYGTVITEGIKYFADKAEAYWLIDDIVLNAKCVKEFKNQDFIVAKTSKNRGIVVKYEDGNDNEITVDWYPDSELPDNGEFTIWMVNDTVLLPSEY